MVSIGLCYNCDIRENGTAFYLRCALDKMATGKRYRPGSPVEKHDFYLYVDDGRDDIKWIPQHPNAYWAIDTHLGYGYRVWKARHFDKVFVAQKDAVAKFKADGVKDVQWLPLACSPEHHCTRQELQDKYQYPVEMLSTDWDVAFVGFINRGHNGSGHNRLEYLDRFKREFNTWCSFGFFHEEMSLRYCKARIGLNVSILDDLNMRVFEVMSTGCPLLTNADVTGISDWFDEGTHYVGYEGLEEAVERGKWMLENPDICAQIADNAIKNVRKHHTYRHRAEEIIKQMEGV